MLTVLQTSHVFKSTKIKVFPESCGPGPASFAISDPDGNTILFDQHA
jgi:hypothetical protein